MGSRHRGATLRPRIGGAALAVGLLLLAAPAAVATPPDSDPFLVPADSLARQHRVVAISHVQPFGAGTQPVSEGGDRVIGDSIEVALNRIGYESVSPDTVLSRWTAAVALAGGLHDRRTGRRDPVRVHAAADRFLRALADSLRCDLRLQYGIVVVDANWDGFTAEWDGVKLQSGHGVISKLLNGGNAGAVHAWSLWVQVDDLRGHTLYARRAGLLPCVWKIDGGWIEVTPLMLVQDQARIDTALNRALGPWIRQVPAAPANR